jgi:pyruvate dehydrogenase E2 component (dihydrolipoamide acetyltransferase)
VPDIVGIPKLGLSDFGELVSWEVSVGDEVEAGDLLAIIESDKASAEVEAPVDGVLLAVYVEPGTEIEIEPGRPIAVIGEQGEEPPPASEVSAGDTTTAGPGEDTDDSSTEAPAAAGGGADTASPGSSDVTATDADAGSLKVSPRARRAAAEADRPVDFAAVEGTGPEGSVVEADVLTHLGETGGAADGAEAGVPDRAVRATPSARRLARESGIDLDSVWAATGGTGTITTTEVRARIEGDRSDGTTATPATQSATDLTVTETRTLSGTRRTIADRLSASAREKPHVMGTREISIEHLRRVQERLADAHGVDASISDLVFYAVGRTLRDMPAFNAHFVDGEHRLFEEVNVGYAVDGPSGLVVPVVEDVANRPFADVAADRSALVERVLDGDHSAADLSGGTFTVTNVGAFDMDVSYSIINPPQVAILAMGRVKERAVERDGDIALEEVVTFSLTIDHRVLDGADSGRFLDELADNLEFPGRVFEV